MATEIGSMHLEIAHFHLQLQFAHLGVTVGTCLYRSDILCHHFPVSCRTVLPQVVMGKK